MGGAPRAPLGMYPCPQTKMNHTQNKNAPFVDNYCD